MAEVRTACSTTAAHRLIGRDALVAEARAALADDSLAGVFVTGAEGAGKSSLIEAVLDPEYQVEIDPTAVDGDDEPPGAPAVEIVRVAGSSMQSDRPYGVLRLLLAGACEMALAGDAAAVIVALRDRLRAPGGARRLRPVVAVDNAHLVDEHSLSALTQLVIHGHIRLVIASETAAPPIDLVTRLCAAGRLHRIAVTGLTPDQTRELLEQRLGGAVACGSVEEVHECTEGNPRLVLAALHGHRARRSIAVDHGVFTFTDRTDLSTLGRDHVEQRLARVAPDLHRVLRIVCLAHAVPTSLLERLVPCSDIDALVESGLLTADQSFDPVLTARDRVMSRVVSAVDPPAQCRVLWEECSERLPWGELAGETLLGFAEWAVRVGGEVDPSVLARAAAVAGDLGRWTTVLDLAANPPPNGLVHPGLLIEHARARVELGDRATARELTAQAEAILLATADGDHADRADGDHADAVDPIPDDRAAGHPAAGSPDDVLGLLPRLRAVELGAREVTETAEPAWPSAHLDAAVSDAGRTVIEVARTNWELRCGHFAESASRADRVLASDRLPPGIRTRTHALRGLALITLGRLDEGLRDCGRALRVAEHPEVSPAESYIARVHALAALSFAGIWEPTGHILRPDSVSHLPVLIARARWSLNAGATSDAIEALRCMHATMRVSDPLGGLGAVIAGLRYVLRSAGLPADADRVPSAGERPAVSWLLDHEAVRLEHLADAVLDPEDARVRLRELGLAALRTGAALPAARCFVDAAVLGDDSAAVELAGVAGGIDALFGYFVQCFAAGFGDGDVPLLLEAARSAADLNEVGWSRQIAEVALARALDSGEHDLARESRRVLRNSRQRLLAGSAPSAGRAGLSDLERRLARGAARGTSNAELGRMAHLSPKTVEWYMSRIYRKLHVTDRSALGAALGITGTEVRR